AVRALEALRLVPEPRPRQTMVAAAPPAAAPGTTVDLPPEAQDSAEAFCAAAAAGQTLDAVPASSPSAERMTVLLLEPSRSQAAITRGQLQKLGFRDVTPAPSGQKALELVRHDPPWVVVSAMHLADMTGMQLAQALRADGLLSSTGFVLITSQGGAAEANLSR